jgi:hypothetical protein
MVAGDTAAARIQPGERILALGTCRIDFNKSIGMYEGGLFDAGR